MHLRFRASPHHPNAALVAALTELSDYEELLGESFRSDAFAKAAAALKATEEVASAAQLDALGAASLHQPGISARGTLRVSDSLMAQSCRSWALAAPSARSTSPSSLPQAR